MRLWRRGTPVFIALTLGAVTASGALGAITTQAAQLYVEDTVGVQTTLATGTSRVTNAKIVDHTKTELGTKFTLKGEVGTGMFKVPLELTATGLSCVGCKAENKVSSTGASTIGTASVQLEFTGVTVMTPTGCHEASNSGVKGTLLTEPLTVHVDWMHEERAFISVFPTTAGGFFARFKVTEGNCGAIASVYAISGSLYGETKSKTATFAEFQEVEFSPAIQTTTGAALKLGGNPAELTGTAAFSVRNAANTANVKFGVK